MKGWWGAAALAGALALLATGLSCSAVARHPGARTPEAAARPPAPAERPAPSAAEVPEEESGLSVPEPPLPREGAPGSDSAPPEPPAPSGSERRANVDGGRVLIRVGLASDLEQVALPCCDAQVGLTVGTASQTLRAPFSVEPAAGSVQAAEHRLQVAALHDEHQAEELGATLSRSTGWSADARFDAASGLYRVRLGRFADRDQAEAARRRLAGLGYPGAWVVEEGGGLVDPALRVRTADRSFRVFGRWVAVESAGGEPLAVSVDGRSGRYRGRLLVFLNDRGSLNLIDELPVEEYLRGVVPDELGPELYPRIEALKAQAVAARTYALRHLGEFAPEGYDICAGPRCQVYGGVGAEHPLSDRAVADTAGQVLLYGDELIEALYSATCGGHTEDASVVFPWLDAPYLKGVPCLEGGHDSLGGSLAAGTSFPGGLTRKLVPAGGAAAGRPALEARLRSLARQAGLPETGDRLRSLDRAEVRRYVRSLFDLVLDPSLLAADGTGGAGGAPLLPGVRPASLPATPTAAGSASKDARIGDAEAEWMILSLSRLIGLLGEDEVRFRSLDARELHGVTVDGAAPKVFDLPAGVATFARRGGRLVAEPLDLAPGDRLRLYTWQGRPAGVVQEAEPDGSGQDRRARLRTWKRFRSDRRLSELVGERFPGFQLRGLEVVSRGKSGRVGAMRLLGADGTSELIEGLAVRWTLDLPDTRFEAERVKRPGHEPGWLFTGGGWGHGVGMCQIGAYAMAGRGLDYRDILEHYYTGVHLGKVVVRRTRVDLPPHPRPLSHGHRRAEPGGLGGEGSPLPGAGSGT